MAQITADTATPLTMQEALEADYFHYGPVCAQIIGPRSGITYRVERYHRNGRTQTWRTRPTEYRVPVKYGLRGYGQITHHDADRFHPASRCPIEALRY
jgi:hypothetical protein